MWSGVSFFSVRLHLHQPESSKFVIPDQLYHTHHSLLSTACVQTPRYFDEIYENRSMQLGYTPGLVRGLSYDAIWALALALNRTQDMFLSNSSVTEIGCGGLDGGLVPLEQFNYSNGVMGCVIRWNLEQTNFSGVSVSLWPYY